jgi:predicted nucleic acid-binding protein
MMIVVPDASVILKWVLQPEGEPDTGSARRVLEAFLEETIEIRVPSLWRYEVGNILAVKRPGTACEAMEALLCYRFEEEQLHSAYCLETLRFAAEAKGISFFDAAYHVLAIRTDGLFLTADRKYVGRAWRHGKIMHVADWKSPA